MKARRPQDLLAQGPSRMSRLLDRLYTFGESRRARTRAFMVLAAFASYAGYTCMAGKSLWQALVSLLLAAAATIWYVLLHRHSLQDDDQEHRSSRRGE